MNMTNFLGSIRSKAAALSVLVFVVIAETASAQATYSLAPATDGIVSQVTGVLTTVLPIAGGLLALTIGWKLLKKMTKSA